MVFFPYTNSHLSEISIHSYGSTGVFLSLRDGSLLKQFVSIEVISKIKLTINIIKKFPWEVFILIALCIYKGTAFS